MDALDYIRTALAIETLSYQNKNYLSQPLSSSDAKTSETIQGLLREAERALIRERGEKRNG